MESNVPSTPHMKSLAMCTNRIMAEGYTENFKATDRGLTSLNATKHYFPEEIHIVNFFRFEGDSNPEDNAIMYVLEMDDGVKGTLIDAYGTYADQNITRIMQQVSDIQKKTTR